MKKLVLSAALVMSVFVASAQTGSTSATSSGNYTSRVTTDNDIRQAATQLQLNEGQYIKFRDLSRARNEQLREANNMYANDATAYKNRVQVINKDFESQLAQSVSQKQYSDYLASQGRAPAGSENQAAGYGGNSLESGAAVGTSVNGGAVNTNTNLNANDPNQPKIMNNEGMSERKKDRERRKNKMKNKNKDK